MEDSKDMFVYETPELEDEPAPRDSERDTLRGGLRGDILEALVKISGVPDAQMVYKETRYARLIVLRYVVKLMGWPEGVPFVNLSSRLLGGIASLRILREAWDKGELRFERATPEDLEKAAEDPLSVLPDGGRCLEVLAQAKSQSSTSEAIAPPPDAQPLVRVLHPIDLSELGEHDADADVDPDSGMRPHHQRSDVKKARRRPKKNPTNRPLRRPKTGVKSSRGVLELDDAEGSARGRKRTRYSLVDDPVRQIVKERVRADGHQA